MAVVPLMEMLHAVFHRALVRAELVVAALHQCQSALVHAFSDFIVFHASFHVGGALGFDEIAFAVRTSEPRQLSHEPGAGANPNGRRSEYEKRRIHVKGRRKKTVHVID